MYKRQFQTIKIHDFVGAGKIARS